MRRTPAPCGPLDRKPQPDGRACTDKLDGRIPEDSGSAKWSIVYRTPFDLIFKRAKLKIMVGPNGRFSNFRSSRRSFRGGVSGKSRFEQGFQIHEDWSARNLPTKGLAPEGVCICDRDPRLGGNCVARRVAAVRLLRERRTQRRVPGRAEHLAAFDFDGHRRSPSPDGGEASRPSLRFR